MLKQCSILNVSPNDSCPETLSLQCDSAGSRGPLGNVPVRSRANINGFIPPSHNELQASWGWISHRETVYLVFPPLHIPF